MKTTFPAEIAPQVERCERMRRHKIITAEIEAQLPALRSQDGKGDAAIVYLKWFHPMSNWTWYITEYDPKTREWFGFVRGHEDELGYGSLDEIATVIALGLPVERDLHFKPCTLGDIKEGRKS